MVLGTEATTKTTKSRGTELSTDAVGETGYNFSSESNILVGTSSWYEDPRMNITHDDGEFYNKQQLQLNKRQLNR